MKIIQLCHDSDLADLQGRWNEVLNVSTSNSLFLSWEWMFAWWHAYGVKGTLRMLLAIDDGGHLRAIVPLVLNNKSRFGISRRCLSFLGAGSNDSEYLDFIVERGFEAHVASALDLFIRREIESGTIVLLDEIPETSPNLSFLRSRGQSPEMCYLERDAPCAVVVLPNTWEEYLSCLKPRFRTKVRSVLRQLESCPNIEFGFCRSQADLDAVLPALFELHTRRWKQERMPGVFQGEAKRLFYRDLSARLLNRDWLRCSWLKWNGRVLACQFGFLYNHTYSHLQEGYEPESEHWNLGVGLRAWSVREFLKEGATEYDFLGGFGRHKADWGAIRKVSKCLTISSNSPTNRLFCLGDEWRTQARESLRNHTPAPVLKARETFLKQREAASFKQSAGGGKDPSGIDWKRKALATLYFRTPPLSAASRFLREHYQLSPALSPRHWRMPIAKRTLPNARIFYYHRVNDDQDPFIPAMSTKIFESQMRFLSRHYRVVPLSRLMQHLRDGSPGSVISITFDDGYQDNYRHAFPILQKYDLPATIFLTTGAIDSRAPLWFERLALALKTTSCEHVDLEIDIPRRFWLRTSQEKLAANQNIFRLLRTLSDEDRTDWASRILALLAPPESLERSEKMLTWPQVREMNSRQIDFGGHTVTHPFLSKLTGEQAEWEVAECKRRIQEETQREVEFFAYPNGREEDFSAANKLSLSKAGYKAALTTIWGLNYPHTNPLELRRGQPWEEDPALFAYKLDWYQLANR